MTQGRYLEALTTASWPGALEGYGNWRPLALWSYALEWSLWDGAPFGFHLVSVLAYALVCLLVHALMRVFFDPAIAGIGAGFFAVHPVHVEAVANVMGRSEIYAGLGYFAACLVYLRWRPPTAGARGLRLLAVLGLFVVALAAKEIAVTLPAVLVLLELWRGEDAPMDRVRDQGLTWVAAFALLGCYVLVRWSVLGDVTGESPAAGLASLDTSGRLLTALTVWPHYLRLLFFPLDLSADYSPAVLMPTTAVNAAVVIGGLILAALAGGAFLLRTRWPLLAIACAWFVITISPVSNLLVRSDVLLAERTLFIPSFAAALAVGVLAREVFRGAERSTAELRSAGAAFLVVGLLLAARSVDRNPSWMDSFAVMDTLNEEHPESWMALRVRAGGLHRVGETEAAISVWETAIEVASDHYQVLIDAAAFFQEIGRTDRAEALLTRATEVLPAHPVAYRRLATYRIERGEGRAAHAAAAAGIRAARNDHLVWALLSETYVMKGDLEAAVRARTASVAERPTPAGWNRLAELYDALDRPEDAAEARRRARTETGRA